MRKLRGQARQEESTGSSWLVRQACQEGVNPRQARNVARATGDVAKTDAIDARMLCLMGQMFADRL